MVSNANVEVKFSVYASKGGDSGIELRFHAGAQREACWNTTSHHNDASCVRSDFDMQLSNGSWVQAT